MKKIIVVLIVLCSCYNGLYASELSLYVPTKSSASVEIEEKQWYINNNLVLYALESRYYKTYPKDARVAFKLKNKGSKTLRKVEVTIYFKDSSGTTITEETHHPVLVNEYSFDKKLLKPNYIIKAVYACEHVPSEWKEGAVSVKITDIELYNTGKDRM